VLNTAIPLGPSPAVQGDTFMRAPRVGLEQLQAGQVAVLGVPHEITKISRAGTSDAPKAIRDATLMFEYGISALSDGELADLDSGVRHRYIPETLVDLGDLELSNDVHSNMRVIDEAVAKIVDAGATPFVLGGDHFISFPVVRAVGRALGAPIAYVHVDMHFDLGDDSPGFGRYSCGTPVRRLIDEGPLDPRNVVIAGLDPLQPASEVDFARRAGITCLTSARLRADGPGRALKQALDRIVTADIRGIYVSFDIDVFARVYAPGTGNAVGATGLSPDDALDMARVLRGYPIVGLDVVEVSPRWDASGSTAGLAVAIASELLWDRLFRSRQSESPPRLQ
jgi:arginase family enzyme